MTIGQLRKIESEIQGKRSKEAIPRISTVPSGSMGITTNPLKILKKNPSEETKITFGVKGSCTTTRDIEGEVW